MTYDPAHVARWYDEYGEREWTRLESSVAHRVNFHIHKVYLRKYVRPNDLVLEAGAGRFTTELAKLGAKVVVGDLSPVQLQLYEEKVTATGCEGSAVDRELLGIVDLSDFLSEHFDVVCVYGGRSAIC